MIPPRSSHGITYQTLHLADKQTVEDLASLVGVTNIFESLGAVLTGDI